MTKSQRRPLTHSSQKIQRLFNDHKKARSIGGLRKRADLRATVASDSKRTLQDYVGRLGRA